MWRICVVLLSVGLLAGCASSGRSEQVVVLRENVVDLRERMNELQEQVAELTAHREVAACRLPIRWVETKPTPGSQLALNGYLPRAT